MTNTAAAIKLKPKRQAYYLTERKKIRVAMKPGTPRDFDSKHFRQNSIAADNNINNDDYDDIRDKIIMAPMVRGSELAFRNLVRSTGLVTPCYSPMVPAEKVVRAFELGRETVSKAVKDGHGQESLAETQLIDATTVMHEEDGILLLEDIMVDTEPLVVQLCGTDPEVLYQACRLLLQLNTNNDDDDKERPSSQIVGIDLNLGCPQHCARRCNFGAFLAEEQPALAIQCVAAMRRAFDDYKAEALKTTTTASSHDDCRTYRNNQKRQQIESPRLSCKIRLRDTVEETILFARQLQQAGCEMLTVHCRRREEKHQGLPDYDAGAAIVAALNGILPVVINGNVWTMDDARRLLKITKAHAIMVARGFLRNPLMLMSPNSTSSSNRSALSTAKAFDGSIESLWLKTPLYMAASYLDHVEKHPPPSPLYIRTHFRWIFRAELEPNHKDDRDYTDWKVRLWTFLVRPYLETIYQFRQVLVLYARLKYRTENDNSACSTTSKNRSFCSCIPLPKTLAHFPEVSFQSVRHNIESEALDEEDAAGEGGLALGLFD